MRKTKYLVMMLFVILMILIPATFVNAYEDAWTYGEGDNAVSVKKIVDNDNGSVTFTFTNINVEADKNYEWGVSSTENINDVEKWYTLVENYPDSKSANLALLSSNTDMRKILRSNIFVYLFIRDKNNAEQFLINKLKVDLTLPLLNAYHMQVSSDEVYRIYEVYGIRNTNMLYQFEKITDENIINQYLEKKTAGKDFSEITSLKSFSDIPTSNWKKPSSTYSYGTSAGIYKSVYPKEDGLYYLWVQSQDDSSKKIVGYTLFYAEDANAPTVESIQVTDPKEGTYKSGQTVKIRAYFSENITGDSVPTLKIKFGTSPERSLTNGTIKNKYIEYSYDIQDSDVGQLATVSFEGGSIKDATGNSAKLSCPIISGYTIKANVEGTTTTQTDNQDKTENKTNGGSTTTNNGGSTTESSTSTNTSNKNIPTGVQTYNGHSYFIFEQKMGWQNAKEYCEAQGGHLVTITSEEEQNFIKSYIQSKKYGNVRFWIGATDKDSEGNWKWVTGEKFEYSNWGKGEPDNLNGDQHYALIQNYNISASLYTIDEYKWDDIASTNLMFICEWDDVNVAKSVNSDSTTATKILPNTGEKTIIFVVISVVIVAGVFAYFYFVKMKDVK